LKSLGPWLVSNLLTAKHRQVERRQSQALLSQEKLFRAIRRSLRGTDIFRVFDLKQVRDYNDYLTRVPICDYDFYKPFIDRVAAGEDRVLFNDKLEFLGVTSGTSGYNSKLIPYNKKMMRAFKAYQTKVAAAIIANNLKANPCFANRLVYGSQMPDVDTSSRVPMGYVSGIIASRAPRMMRKTSYPRPETLSIGEWDVKVQRIIEETKDIDIRIVGGVPTYMINVFEQLLATTGAATLKDLWPHLECFVYSGTHIENYRQRLDELAGLKLHYIGGYVATEAPMGWNVEDKGAFRFNVDSLLFSFTPTRGDTSRPLGIHELQVGERYKVNIGTPNGMLQYAMKDVVAILSVDPVVTFEIVGREDTAINIAMEKTSHHAINKVIEQSQKALGRTFDHFFLCPGTTATGIPCYDWTFVTDDADHLDHREVARLVDDLLQCHAHDYKECRLDGETIGSPCVNFLPRAITNEYFRRFRSKGQLKMKSFFPSKEALLELIRELSPERT
jgi:hypothetical protein